MTLRNQCQFAGDCEIYNGSVTVSETPLLIFRNVFCNRGMKGWKNCEKYIELTSAGIKKKNNNYEVKKQS